MATTRGRGVLGGSLALIAAGFACGYQILYLVGLAGVLTVGCAVIWTLAPVRLTVERHIAPSRVVRGETASGVLEVHHARRFGLQMVIYDTAADTTMKIDPAHVSRGQCRISYDIPTSRRGVITVGPLHTEHRDALGLASRARTQGECLSLTVLPRTVPLATRPAGPSSQLEGRATDRPPTGVSAFHTIREYLPGDDLRLVHWPSTAHAGQLMVRRLTDASMPRTSILIDDRKDAYRREDDLELAVEAAASIALAAARLRCPLQIISTAGLVLSTHGRLTDVHAVLEALTLLPDAAPGAAPPSPLNLGRPRQPGGTLIVVGPGTGITDVSGFRRHHDRVSWVRIRPQQPAPGVSGLVVTDLHRLDDLAEVWRRAAGR